MKDLVILAVKYLRKELEGNLFGSDGMEEVEEAAQHLENAYRISPSDLGACTVALEDLYHAGLYSAKVGRIVTAEQREEAARLKLACDKLMWNKKYPEAVNLYTRAISLDPKNAVYFSNRAAALIKLHKFLEAINDCKEAIKLDPSYSKAYSRLGNAYEGVGNKEKARICYSKAVSLQPESKKYRHRQKKLKDQWRSDPGCSSEAYLGIDLTPLLRHPESAHLVGELLEDPEMQEALHGILSGEPMPDFQDEEDKINETQNQIEKMKSDLAELREKIKQGEKALEKRGYRKDLKADQEPTMEQLPSSSSLPTPPAGFGPESTSAQNSVGVSWDGPSSSGLQGKAGQDRCDVDRSNGRDGAN